MKLLGDFSGFILEIILVCGSCSLVISQVGPEDQLGASEECLESIGTCAIPVVAPYLDLPPDKILSKARSLPWIKHCSTTTRAVGCLNGAFGSNQCSTVDEKAKLGWQVILAPVASEALTYMCKTEKKKFSRHYRCLLSDYVVMTLARICMEKVSQAASPSEKFQVALQCESEVVRTVCGAEAAQIVYNLDMVVLNSLMKQVSENQELLESIMAETGFERNLMLLTEFFLRR